MFIFLARLAWVLVSGMVLYGNQSVVIEGVSSVEECKDTCWENSDCHSFDFFPAPSVGNLNTMSWFDDDFDVSLYRAYGGATFGFYCPKGETILFITGSIKDALGYKVIED